MERIYQGGGRLVCTLWIEHIVDVFDPEVGRVCRFVKLGGKSREWKGGAVACGDPTHTDRHQAAVGLAIDAGLNVG